MKYLKIFALFLLVSSCNNPSGNASDAVGNENNKMQQDGMKAVEKTIPPTNDMGEEMTEQAEGLLRGKFIYAADAAIFIECGTEAKYPVTGDAYLAIEKDYLKKRTRDFQEIYVEIKGEIKVMKGMEGVDVKTLSADELIIMDTEKSCN